MKKLVYLSLLLFLIFTACETPMDIGVKELEEALPSLFNRDLLKTGNDFSIGYESGNIRSDQVKLEWEQSQDPKFRLYSLKRNDQNDLTFANFINVEETCLIDSTVEDNTLYEYELIVITDNGMQARDTISIKTAQWEAPDNLSANGFSNTDVKLCWNDNSDSEDNFVIYLFDNRRALIDSFTVQSNYTEKLILGLDNQGLYFFQVKAVSQWEEDALISDTESFDMSDFILLPPSSLFLEQNSDYSIDIVWNDNATLETGYLLERKKNLGNFQEIADLTYNSEYYCDMDTTYYSIGDTLTYRLRAYNSYGEETQYTDYSEEAHIVIFEIAEGIYEDFNDGIANNWIDDDSGRWGVISNEYVMTGNNSETEALSYYNSIFNDFSYEVDICKTSGQFAHALYFRGDGVIDNYGQRQNGYLFDFCNTSYSIFLCVDGNSLALVGWTECSFLNPHGQTNNVKVNCLGPNLNFYINGYLVEEIYDSTFLSGFVGVWAYDENNDITLFDNAVIENSVEDIITGRAVNAAHVNRNILYNSEVSK